MKIFVKARPNAKEARVEKLDDMHFIVSIREPPVSGRANRAIEKALSEYFKIPVSRLNIVSGHTSRSKVIHIL